MSHSVIVNVAMNCKHEITLLEQMEKDIKDLPQVINKHLESEVQKISTKLQQIKNEIAEQDGKKMEEEVATRYMQKFSQVVKETANIKYSLDYGLVIFEEAQIEKAKIKDIIRQNGLMALLSIEDLKVDGKPLTHNNLVKQIDENRQKEVEEAKLKQILEKIKMKFIESSLPDDIKAVFVQEFKKAYSYQELSDLGAFIDTKIMEFTKMKALKKDVVKALREVGFSYLKQEDKFDALKDNTMKVQITAFKNGTNELEITISSNMQMHWKFGDYENHLCDADGEAFRESLKKHNVSTSYQHITRNISNSRRLNAQKMRQRSK